MLLYPYFYEIMYVVLPTIFFMSDNNTEGQCFFHTFTQFLPSSHLQTLPSQHYPRTFGILMPRTTYEKKEVCPACERTFKSVAQHLSSPYTSCRPWYGDLISISELLAKMDSQPTLSSSPLPSPALSQSEIPLPDTNDIHGHSYSAPLDFKMGNASFSSNLEAGCDSNVGDGPIRDGDYATMHENTLLVKEGGEMFMERFDKDQLAEERKQNIYYLFANRDDWEMAYWLLNSGLSMVAIDKFLSLSLVRVTSCWLYTIVTD